MGINSLYAVNVQTAAENSAEQIVRLALGFLPNVILIGLRQA